MAGILEYLQSLGLSPSQFVGPEDQNASMDRNYSSMQDAPMWAQSQAPQEEEAPSAPPLGMAGVQAQMMQGARQVDGPDTNVFARGPAPYERPQGPDLSAFSPEALSDAQEEARQKRTGVGILGSISDAVSGMTGTRPDSDTWKNLSAEANAPVTDLQAQQKNILGGLDANSKISAFQKDQEMNDPNSPVARAYKDAVKRFLPQVNTEGLSGAELSQLVQKVSPMVDAQAKLESAKATREYTRQTRASNDDKKAVSEMYNKAQQTQSRGSVKNAWDALRLADNADSVIHDIETDPKMDTTRMQNILSAEVAKLASGGAATEAGQRDIRPPDTLRAGLATMWEKVSSNPSPAGLRNFAIQLKPYLSQLKDNAQKRVGESLVNVRNGYKGRVNEDALKDFDDQYGSYIDSYKGMKNNSGGAAGAPVPGGGGAPGGFSAQQEKGIARVMEKNGVSREQAVSALKAAGKL